MKTIEERALEYANSGATLFMDSPEENDIYCDDIARSYIAGAKDEREELLCWRDPKKEQPEDGATVLGKYCDPQRPFDIVRYINGQWYKAYHSWSGPSGEVIGWRPIYD